MSTRQRKNSRLTALPVPVALCLMLTYFLSNAWSGRFGVDALAEMEAERTRLEFELVRLQQERKQLARRVELMRDGGIERDMLDEQARAVLGLIGPGEIAILP
jgi:cell division protein FtsB